MVGVWSSNNKKGKERKKERKQERKNEADGGEGQERKTKFEQEVARVKRKAPVARPWRVSEWSGVVGQVEVPL